MKDILKKKVNSIFLFVSVLYIFFISLFGVDSLFFVGGKLYKVILVKFSAVVVLALIFEFFYNIIYSIIYKEKKIDYIKNFLVVFIIYLIIFFLVFPGTWSLDDIMTISRLKTYNFDFWQHFLTSYYQAILLTIFPSPVFIILFNNFIIAIIVSYFITLCTNLYNNNFKNSIVYKLLKFLPFFIPPVIFYQMSGFRMGLYVYLDFLCIFLLFLILDKKIKNNVIFVLFYALLTAIVSVWRTESFVYVYIINIIFIILYFKNKNSLFKKSCLLYIILSFSLFFILSFIQTKGLKSNSYNVTSLYNTVTELVKNADDNDITELKALEKVFNIEEIYRHRDLQGQTINYLYSLEKNNYTKEDYYSALFSIVTLSLKHPKAIILERLNQIKRCIIDAEEFNWKCDDTRTLFDTNNQKIPAKTWKDMNLLFGGPLNNDIRAKVINLLCLHNGKFLKIKLFAYNGIIPLILLLFCFMTSIVLKHYNLAVALLPLLFKLPLIIITAPSQYLMYYLSYVLIGYIVFVYYIFYIFKIFVNKNYNLKN